MGIDCLPRLNGMWSFLVYDERTQRLFGARDRFGIKPLYVHRARDAVLLASEIKSIRDGGLTNLSVDWKPPLASGRGSTRSLDRHVLRRRASRSRGARAFP